LKVHEPPQIVFIGRFTVQKNVLELIDIMDTIRDLPWKCTLVGDGPQRNGVEQKIHRLGLSDRFSLPGWVSPEKVRKFLSSSDILFMPSLNEGFSVVGIQALSAGLAIIAYRVGGFTEMVAQERNGFLAEPGDTKALSSALRNYLTDKGRLLTARQGSWERAKRFDIHQVVDQYNTLIKSFSKLH
jgi:glycosyltransferase involved in cell wall biosynthesis